MQYVEVKPILDDLQQPTRLQRGKSISQQTKMSNLVDRSFV